MNIYFSKRYLEDIYQGKTNKHKEFKSNPQLVKQYIKTIDKLRGITKIEQLYQLKSLHYEKKVGNLDGISAVWVNKQYRILFRECSTDPNSLTIDLLEIEDLSKHYE
ncbi:type II toxin-antitoxin system RelE/ParE family toxin [Marinifilum caeruleilacunae]|uniref:Plasmid maintenance system killer protein n=1 Tax=Marinifilum caeruleilacunae TaxID=2499076 RepID=A0ABX1WYW6_9BACT|nr:type II toxin-antitoxin system RelE/ParE family toxin [Marinifilum caeruleilacunae]NOU61055.1 plasmid maintenance system killer protein [Marinifilum caeruleilacunae]